MLIVCKECSQQVSDQAPFCPHCGAVLHANANANAGQPNGQQTYQQDYRNTARSPFVDTDNVFDNGPSGRSRGIAAILAFLLGALGIHYFYLGKNTAGVVFILVSLCTCGWCAIVTEILSIVSGVKMLTMSQERFEQDYIHTSATIPI